MESGRRDHPVVLVCDDTEQIRQLIRINLELDGYVVEEFDDGAALVARLHDAGAATPDLVLLDVSMTPRDGWWTIAEVRRTWSPHALPVVMVTASTQHHDGAQANAAGCNAFLPKPFDPDDLLAVVVRFVGPAATPHPGP